MRRVGIEFRRSYQRRIDSGFMARFLSGERILDVGYLGGDPEAVPITDNAVGIGLDYPGYDGVHLPFPDGSQDAVLASHVLEHVPSPREILADWYRVLRVGGYLVILVPHRYLYERRPNMPSLWNGDHRRFYTPATLLTEAEAALPVNGFRVRHLLDNDAGFDYARGPKERPVGCYEIEMVLEKIDRPFYSDYLEPPPELTAAIQALDTFFTELVSGMIRGERRLTPITPRSMTYVTPWRVLRERLRKTTNLDESQLREIVAPLLVGMDVDADWYISLYPDLAKHPDPGLHWRLHGYFEGRVPCDLWPFGDGRDPARTGPDGNG